MADIFGDPEPAVVADEGADILAQDPAAEFLAQQEDEIAGLENDVLGSVEEPEVVTNGFEPVQADADFFAAVPSETITNGIEEDVDAEPAEMMDPSQAYAAIAAASARIEELKLEPEKIRLWREENNKLLAEKDAESERKKEELLIQAKKELEDWDRNREEQLQKTRESNRLANDAFMKQLEDSAIGYTAAEEQFVKDRDNSTPGSEWERVSRLCDFNPKASKGSKDVSRMRSSLLHLKQNPRPIQPTLSANE